MPEILTTDEKLHSIGQFMDHTRQLTLLQLGVLRFLKKVAAESAENLLVFAGMRYAITEVIKANVDELGGALTSITPAGFSMLISHPRGDRVALVGGVDFSEELGTYAAATGLQKNGEPRLWPLSGVGQLIFAPDDALANIGLLSNRKAHPVQLVTRITEYALSTPS